MESAQAKLDFYKQNEALLGANAISSTHWIQLRTDTVDSDMPPPVVYSIDGGTVGAFEINWLKVHWAEGKPESWQEYFGQENEHFISSHLPALNFPAIISHYRIIRQSLWATLLWKRAAA